jgi:putative peptidoglycan lipid II flippase
VLAFLCLGLGGWAAQTVISRGFYALGSTWLPTLVGTLIAVAAVPVYVLLRQQSGATGLAVASSGAILIYVAVLGLMQRRRFEREAAARGVTLRDVPGMLDPALRLAVATAIAIAAGLALRIWLVEELPGVHLPTVLMRASLLCATSLGVYLAMARLFGISEIGRLERMLLRKLRLRRPAPLRRG